jgi:hypothetical protein
LSAERQGRKPRQLPRQENTISRVPVFYDIEASSLDGFPIEIGWARADLASGTILSEGHLIRPPPDWAVLWAMIARQG